MPILTIISDTVFALFNRSSIPAYYSIICVSLCRWLDLKYNLIIFEDGRVRKKGGGTLPIYP
jgi:hypothetical protein